MKVKTKVAHWIVFKVRSGRFDADVASGTIVVNRMMESRMSFSKVQTPLVGGGMGGGGVFAAGRALGFTHRFDEPGRLSAYA